MKRVIVTIIGAFLLLNLLPASALAAESPRVIPVTYRGRTVLKGEAVLLDSVTYVPFRALCEALGEGEVSWEDKTKTAYFHSDELTVTARQGACYLEANGRALYCAAGILNRQGRLYLPIRPLAAALGCRVEWDPAYRIRLYLDTPLLSGDAYYDTEDLYWLSRIISAESRGESLLGKIAVGNVVLNRVKHPQFPNTVYDVIYQKGQFTPASSGTLHQPPTEESLLAAKLCLEGATVADDALFFCNPAIAVSTWIQRNRPYLMTLGNHAFYA